MSKDSDTVGKYLFFSILCRSFAKISLETNFSKSFQWRSGSIQMLIPKILSAKYFEGLDF
jgi:hypothetical protein